jgi:hypothetical protein
MTTKTALTLTVAAVAAGLVVLVVAGCGGQGVTAVQRAESAKASVCPAAWKAGWQRLANRIDAPVYCPTWLPDPLDGRFDGVFNGQTVDPDRSYLVKFLWFDSGLPGGPEEVHVNFRGQPGNVRIPRCDNSTVENGKTIHHLTPCFSDPKARRRFGARRATLYTANQGADQWHLLYAWRENGSLYAISEHVAAPYTYKQVLAHLDRMMETLVRIRPTRTQS